MILVVLRRVQRVAQFLTTVSVLAAMAVPSASAAPSPSARLLAALGSSPPKASLFPASLGSMEPVRYQLSSDSQAHHALGAVGVQWNNAEIEVVVFPSEKLAAADLVAAPDYQPGSPAPAPYGQPSHVYTNAAVGQAFFVYVDGVTLVNVGVDTAAGVPPGPGAPMARTLAAITRSFLAPRLASAGAG